MNQFGLASSPGLYQSWKRVGEDDFEYTINTVFNNLNVPGTAEFILQYREFTQLGADLDLRRKELEKAKAQELWESA